MLHPGSCLMFCIQAAPFCQGRHEQPIVSACGQLCCRCLRVAPATNRRLPHMQWPVCSSSRLIATSNVRCQFSLGITDNVRVASPSLTMILSACTALHSLPGANFAPPADCRCKSHGRCSVCGTTRQCSCAAIRWAWSHVLLITGCSSALV